MSTAVISAYRVATTPQFGGHFWVYMQYAHALRQLGFEVFWLERVEAQAVRRDPAAASRFLDRMERFGFGGRVILYDLAGSDGEMRFTGTSAARSESAFRRAEFLLNFHYAIDERVLGRFRRTALVDIDPGLLQWWISRGQLRVPPHDVYLTIGETVGADDARIDDCGLSWEHIRSPVCLDLWPCAYDSSCRRFTTISSWLGGEYITERGEVLYRNDKSISFLKFAELPSRTRTELELAIYLKGREDSEDNADRALLERRGWRVRDAREVSSTPERYWSYIRSSRGEFGCAKPSNLQFQNAWVSDRTLCYLASGKPVVVEDSGPSAFLPHGEGMFRVSTVDDAAAALAAIERDYRRHCRAARAIAETYFDARAVLTRVASVAIGGSTRPSIDAGASHGQRPPSEART
jgi:hypothetical protein